MTLTKNKMRPIVVIDGKVYRPNSMGFFSAILALRKRYEVELFDGIITVKGVMVRKEVRPSGRVVYCINPSLPSPSR